MNDFKIKLRQRNISKIDLSLDLRLCAQKSGSKTITSKDYQEIGQFGVNTILRRFGSWNNALLEAGLEITNRQNIPDDELFQNLIDIWTTLGRQPLGREMDKVAGLSKISLGTYEKRFGSWNNALLEFERFINSNEQEIVSSETVNLVKSSNRKTPRSINWRLRAQVLIRDNCICNMCGNSPAKNPDVILHVDHIKPYSKGGETVIENLQTLCAQCNIGKSDIYFDSAIR